MKPGKSETGRKEEIRCRGVLIMNLFPKDNIARDNTLGNQALCKSVGSKATPYPKPVSIPVRLVGFYALMLSGTKDITMGRF